MQAFSGSHAPSPSCEPTTCRCLNDRLSLPSASHPVLESGRVWGADSPGVDWAMSIWKNSDSVEQVPQRKQGSAEDPEILHSPSAKPQRVISIWRWQPMAGYLCPPEEIGELFKGQCCSAPEACWT